MIQEDRDLLLKDLCGRLPYGVKVDIAYSKEHGSSDRLRICSEGCLMLNADVLGLYIQDEIYIKPYLRLMYSMTKEEAKEIATLHGLKNILSLTICDEFIDVIVDDGVSSVERILLRYDEIISSIESFDWLNKNMFDYRGLIPKGLAIEKMKESDHI